MFQSKENYINKYIMDSPHVIDSVNTFYKLKQDYEKNVTRMKQKIIHNTTLSNKDKRERFLLLKPKCVNCKKPVGTIFSIKDRKLVAMCGASSSGSNVKRCKLNISIDKGSTVSLETAVDTLKELRTSEKDDIIKNKLNLLFNFISEETALSTFETQKKSLESTESTIASYLKQLVTITELTDKKEQINISDLQIYEVIKSIKELLLRAKKEPDSGKSYQFIHDCSEIYVNQLIPILGVSNTLKYKYRHVIYNEADDTYHLVENPYTTAQLEIVVGEPPLVQSNIK